MNHTKSLPHDISALSNPSARPGLLPAFYLYATHGFLHQLFAPRSDLASPSSSLPHLRPAKDEVVLYCSRSVHIYDHDFRSRARPLPPTNKREKRQIKRPTSSQESSEQGEKLAFADKDSLLAPYMEQDEAELEEVDDDDELSGGRGAPSSSCWLGEKKRRLALEQVRALERSFEKDNKLDPDRKARIARDLGLQPRQVAVWFQNRRARWKTKQIERDFAALRARHEALRADCDALRRDKDALAAEIRELREKLPKSETAVKVEAGNDAAEERQATVGPSAAAIYKDGSSDSDSSAVFNDEASPYSGAVLEQPGFVGFDASFLDSSAATTGCSSLPMLGTKWHGTYSYDSYKSVGYGFTEEWLAGSDAIGNDGAGFFSEEHASSFNFDWCGSGTEGFDLQG